MLIRNQTDCGVRVTSDLFLSKVQENLPNVSYQEIKNFTTAFLDALLDTAKDNYDKLITLDGVFTFSPGVRRQHSPKWRQWYDATRTNLIPRLYYVCNLYPLDNYVYELQWNPDISYLTPQGHRKIATWCQARMKYILKKEPTITEDVAITSIYEASKDFLTREDVIKYLKHPKVVPPLY